jgi:hypothetical protein
MEIDSDADPAYMWSECPAPKLDGTGCMNPVPDGPGCGYGCFCNCECAPDDWTPPSGGEWETYCDFINDTLVDDPDDYGDVDWLYEDGISHLDCADMEEGSCCWTDGAGDGNCDDNNGEGIKKSDCDDYCDTHLCEDESETYFSAGRVCEEGNECDIGACCLDENEDGDVDECLDDQYRIQCNDHTKSVGFGGIESECGEGPPWTPCDLAACCYSVEGENHSIDHHCRNTTPQECFGTYQGNHNENELCSCGSDHFGSPCENTPGACCVKYLVGPSGYNDQRGLCYDLGRTDCEGICEEGGILYEDVESGGGHLDQCASCWHEGYSCHNAPCNSSLCSWQCLHDDCTTGYEILCKWNDDGYSTGVKIDNQHDCGLEPLDYCGGGPILGDVIPGEYYCVSPSRTWCDLGNIEACQTMRDPNNYFDCDKVVGCCLLDCNADPILFPANFVNYITNIKCKELDGSWKPSTHCCVNQWGTTNTDCPGYC